MESGSRVRVLVVEDEWLIADHVQSMLDELGYDVIGPAPTVEDALALIIAQTPDAAVLDVSLASGQSFPVAEALARLGAPFIFITGYVAGDLPLQFRDRPILNKPISLHELKRPLDAMALPALRARASAEHQPHT